MKKTILTFLPLAILGLIWAFTSVEKESTGEGFARFQTEELRQQLKTSGRPYLPFLNKNTLLSGVYRLEAGATDGQEPHEMDEVYYVISGKARFKAGEEDTEIQAGDILFVAARLDHQFYDIAEDLELLVFFSTAKPD